MARLNVLALNAGSSSVKASLYALDAPGEAGAPPSGLLWERDVDGESSLEQILEALAATRHAPSGDVGGIGAVGHRVVHGGAALTRSARLTPLVRQAIADVAEYAPSHNAAALALVDAASRLLGPSVPQVAVFDTAFHRTLAPAAYAYAGPYEWLGQGIRRFGFHGISHEYASARAARLLGRPADGFRVVTCHLGSGCSLAAVRDGRSVDTTMGFTPLDGLAMARRSGAVDPGILIHLLRHGGHTVDSLDHLLNHDSGLAGLSGTSGDMREVLAGAKRGDERATLALDVFVHRAAQGIAAMAAAMGGLDAIAFTGGVGERAAPVRARIVAALAFLGARLDDGRNAECHGECDVSADDAPVRVLVVPSEENWMVARECVRVVRRPG